MAPVRQLFEIKAKWRRCYPFLFFWAFQYWNVFSLNYTFSWEKESSIPNFPTSNRNSRFESRFRTMYIQPKKKFKAQIIGILEEIHSLYWPPHVKRCPKNCARPPPHLDKIQKNAFFFSGERPFRVKEKNLFNVVGFLAFLETDVIWYIFTQPL